MSNLKKLESTPKIPAVAGPKSTLHIKHGVREYQEIPAGAGICQKLKRSFLLESTKKYLLL